MKITKGQLKRIIAEEHALVYGKPKRRKNVRRTNQLAKRRRLAEHKRRKQEILLEAKSALLVEEFIQEGFFGQALAGLKGVFGAAGEGIKAKASEFGKAIKGKWDTAKEEFAKAAEAQKDDDIQKAMKNIMDRYPDEAARYYKDWMQAMAKDLIKAGMEEEEAKATLVGMQQAWADAIPVE